MCVHDIMNVLCEFQQHNKQKIGTGHIIVLETSSKCNTTELKCLYFLQKASVCVYMKICLPRPRPDWFFVLKQTLK